MSCVATIHFYDTKSQVLRRVQGVCFTSDDPERIDDILREMGYHDVIIHDVEYEFFGERGETAGDEPDIGALFTEASELAADIEAKEARLVVLRDQLEELIKPLYR